MSKKLFKKLNNKGNTLGVVLIGIFILSILGTLILGISSTNYIMKLNDKKSKMTFYNAEKAMDQLYTAMGADVMDAVTDSYSFALESYTSNREAYRAADPTTTDDAAYVAFKTKLRDELVNLYEDGVVYTAVALPGTAQERLLARLEGYLPTASGYEFGVDSPTGDIEVKYLKADGTSCTDTDSVDVIKISNVRVKCRSEKTGYVSNIVSDFEISIPSILFDFTDTPMTDGVNDLAKYALLCQGFQLHPNVNPTSAGSTLRDTSSVTIASGAKVTITGNVYTDGSIYTAVADTADGVTYYKNSGTVLANNPSLSLENNAVLDINSKVFYCMNDFMLNSSSEAYLGNNDAAHRDSTDGLESLQFYANNIKTSETSSDAKFYFLGGNCIIRDDLEINGSNSAVYVGGNYFGYGFRDANGDGIEDDTLGADYVANNGSDDLVAKEHRDSSAIIVNGTSALVKMDGTSGILTPDGTTVNIPALSKLILLGRAYIDLDPLGTNYTYMTGESVSFKGNQQVYLSSLERTSELRGSKVTSNPMLESDLKSITGKSTLSDISMSTDLNLDPTKIITKAIRNNPIAPTGSVYFYNRVANPEQQTINFQSIFASGTTDSVNISKKNAIIEQLGTSGLDVQGFALPNTLRLYSVGTVMNVRRNGGIVSITNPKYGYAGSGMDIFNQLDASGHRSNITNFVNVIDNRIKNLETSLHDLSEEAVLLQDVTAIGSVSEEAATPTTIPSPYEYYINREEMIKQVGTGRDVLQLTITNSTGENAAIYGCTEAQALELNKELVSILQDCGLLNADLSNASSLKVGVVLSNDASGGVIENIDLDAGIIVSEKSLRTEKNFTGLIMSHDSAILAGSNTRITANEDLVKFLFANVKELNNILTSNVRITPPVTSGYVVGDGSEIKVSYTDLVKKSNWRNDNN